MAYSELSVLPAVQSISDNNLEFTLVDNTVYAPTGEGTPTFPARNQTIRGWMYRWVPFSNVMNYRYPESPTSPMTFANPDAGNDIVIQAVLVVLPDTFNWNELLDEAYDWDAFLELAAANGAVGQVPVWMNINEANCVYDALRRLNNAFPGNCNMDEWLEKNAMFIGTSATLSLVLPDEDPNAATVEDLFVEAKAQVEELTALCADPTNQCNC